MRWRRRTQAEPVERYWSALTADPGAAAPEDLDPETAATVRRLVVGLRPPDPDPDFAGQLRVRLRARAGLASVRPDQPEVLSVQRPSPRRRRLAPRVAILLALSLLLVAGSVLGNLAIPSSDEAPGPSAGRPRGQSGGGAPEYGTLAALAYAADGVVVAQVEGAPATGPAGGRYLPVQVQEAVRGAVPAAIQVRASSELAPDATYVLFLTRDYDGPPGAFTAIPGGIVQVREGVVAPPSSDYLAPPVWSRYAGRPVAELVHAVREVPQVEADIEALLRRYGWLPVGKAGLWPVQIPDPRTFASTTPDVPVAPASWQAVLELSDRVGLDTAAFAGHEAGLLLYYVEREPTAGGRLVWAAFVLVDGKVAGAWAAVAGVDRAFALDEREDSLRFLPQPPPVTPVPTLPVPEGPAVNLTRFYRLDEASAVTFCWPACEPGPRPDALRDVLVRALDRELPRSLQGPPVPTAAAGHPPESRAGDLAMMFSLPQGRRVTIGYHRETGLLRLPEGGGWVPAPWELRRVLEGLDPPQGLDEQPGKED